MNANENMFTVDIIDELGKEVLRSCSAPTLLQAYMDAEKIIKIYQPFFHCILKTMVQEEKKYYF